MKPIHFAIILLVVSLLGCNNDFNNVHKNSFVDMQNGIDRIITHFLIDEALLNFNKGFADRNNDFKIISYVNKFNNRNKKWERYEELEFYYVKNGEIKSLKEKLFKEVYPNISKKNMNILMTDSLKALISGVEMFTRTHLNVFFNTVIRINLWRKNLLLQKTINGKILISSLTFMI